MCELAVLFRQPEVELPLFQRIVKRRDRAAGGKGRAACRQEKQMLVERKSKRIRAFRDFKGIFEDIGLLSLAIRPAPVHMRCVPGEDSLLDIAGLLHAVEIPFAHGLKHAVHSK